MEYQSFLLFSRSVFILFSSPVKRSFLFAIVQLFHSRLKKHTRKTQKRVVILHTPRFAFFVVDGSVYRWIDGRLGLGLGLGLGLVFFFATSYAAATFGIRNTPTHCLYHCVARRALRRHLTPHSSGASLVPAGSHVSHRTAILAPN